MPNQSKQLTALSTRKVAVDEGFQSWKLPATWTPCGATVRPPRPTCGRNSAQEETHLGKCWRRNSNGYGLKTKQRGTHPGYTRGVPPNPCLEIMGPARPNPQRQPSNTSPSLNVTGAHQTAIDCSRSVMAVRIASVRYMASSISKKNFFANLQTHANPSI